MTLAFPKPERPGKDPKHLARIREQPCIICSWWPTEAHHCIHDRYSQSKRDDKATIPLCGNHHRELHAGPASWRERYGADWSYLPLVRETMGLANEG